MSILLETKALEMHFKGLRAVKGFDSTIEENKIYGLIGTNGAGKTTVINMLSGVLKPTSGSIIYLGNDITGIKPHKIAKLGILRTYQNLRLFKKMTVIENVVIGAQIHRNYNNVQAILQLPAFKNEERELYEKAMDMLKIMGIDQMSQHVSGSLPYGAQRKLEIARILAASPKLLLLDEPAAGMNPHESAELIHILRNIRKQFNLTIVLIEHDMKVVMGLCDYIYAMAFGEVISKGLPEEIRNDPKVIEAFLGRAREHA